MGSQNSYLKKTLQEEKEDKVREVADKER